MSKHTIRIITGAIFVSTFLSAIEGTIISTAMPTIVGDLHGVALMNWVFSIFLLMNALATPVYGKLADAFGRKPVFVAGLLIFIVGSALCGFAQSMTTLILWRAIQGIGAGAIMPVTFTILADIYPVAQRAKVLGLNGSAWGIAAVIAPLLGGFIVDQLSWHWIFFINIPIGLLVLVTILVFFKEKWQKTDFTMDWSGLALLSVGLLALMLTFQMLGQSIHYLWLLAGFIIAFLALRLFWRQEGRAVDPLIPLGLFKDRTFVIQNLIAALISGFVMIYEVYLPTWTQGLLGLKASISGFAVTPCSVMWLLGSLIAGKLLVKNTPYQVVNHSLIYILIGAVAMALLPMNTPFWVFFVISSICGVGFGINITSTTVVAQSSVPEAQVGVATSVNTLAKTLGQTITVAVMGVVMNLMLAHGVAAQPQTSIAMMNQLINPATAKDLPAQLQPTLHVILYQSLHVIYLIGAALIIVTFLFNRLDRRSKALTLKA